MIWLRVTHIHVFLEPLGFRVRVFKLLMNFMILKWEKINKWCFHPLRERPCSTHEKHLRLFDSWVTSLICLQKEEVFTEMVENKHVVFLNYFQGGNNRSKCSPLATALGIHESEVKSKSLYMFLLLWLMFFSSDVEMLNTLFTSISDVCWRRL